MCVRVSALNHVRVTDLITQKIDEKIVCFIATPKILGLYINVVNSSRRNVLKDGRSYEMFN